MSKFLAFLRNIFTRKNEICQTRYPLGTAVTIFKCPVCGYEKIITSYSWLNPPKCPYEGARLHAK